MADVSRDLAADGPSAWLRYFEESSSFFMASDGRSVFPTHAAADEAVADLALAFTRVDIQWIDLRVEPLVPGFAVVGTGYHEILTDTAGGTVEFGGFMTGVARHGPDGWRLRNLHWSSPVPGSDG